MMVRIETGAQHGARRGGRGLRTRILALALIPSLTLVLVGLATAIYTGYRGYRAITQSSALAGGNGGTGGNAAGTDLLQALRDERWMTGEVLADPALPTNALQTQWARTDAAAAVMARSSGQPIIPANELASVAAIRSAVVARAIPLIEAIDRYSTVIAEGDSRGSTSLAQAVADPRVVREDEISKRLSDLTEALDVSDALSFAAFQGAGMSSDVFRAFVHETGDFHTLLTSLQASLPADEAANLNQLTTGPDGDIVSVVQRSIVNGGVWRSSAAATAAGQQAAGQQAAGQLTARQGQPVTGQTTTRQGQPVTGQTTARQGQPVTGQTTARQDQAATGSGLMVQDARLVAELPVSGASWRASTARLSAGLVALQRQHLIYSGGIAREVGIQQLVTASLGSIALLVLALLVLALSLTVSRRLIGRLQQLRQETITLSHDRLPDIVQRLREGEPVDVDAELPALDFGSDEIGQVAEAFGEAQRTAVAAAAQEAETRAGLRAVFLGIARRSQTIVYRQLKVLDQAERAQEDPDQLDLLFQLDHLSTRARRNAENLIILGGEQAGRQWRTPIPLLHVIRSAVSEAEDYARVVVSGIPPVTVRGKAVADLIHLLAELVDNGTTFSPPMSRVEVRANAVGRGLAIEIEDQGLGIEPDQMERLNALLHDPPDFQVMALVDEPRLGLFVVARLAARQGIGVTLTASPAYGGTRAVVLIPTTLLLDDDEVLEPEAVNGRRMPESATGSVPTQWSSATLWARALPAPSKSQLAPAPPAPPASAVPHASAVPPEGPTLPASAVPPESAAPPASASAPARWAAEREAHPLFESAAGTGNGSTPGMPPASGPQVHEARPELPRRVRQTHLSPELRKRAQRPAAPPAGRPQDAEVARSRMSALQRGTQRGRATEPEGQ